MKLDGHRMDTYVQRSPIKSDIPDYTDWYWGFVRDYLSDNTLKGMDKRWCYYDDYYLDIANEPRNRTIASQFLLSWKDFSIALGILVVGSSGVSIIYNPSWTAWLQGTSRP